MRSKLVEPIRISHTGVRPFLRTIDEAVRMIDCDLPPELRKLPRWTFARALLLEARRSGKKRDNVVAVRQIRQALSNEGWLPREEPR